MKPYYSDDQVALYSGDCLDVLPTLPDASVDAVVTDPPYLLGFMGRDWDSKAAHEHLDWHGAWAEQCLRILKPGAHLLAFGGTRTWHRLACAVEDAGFEIRDSIAWLYGSGFPKSLDVSKAIDKRQYWSLVERLDAEIKRAREQAGLSLRETGAAMMSATDGQYGKWYHRGGFMFHETGQTLPSRPEWKQLIQVLPIAPEFIEVYAEAEREVIGKSAHKSGIGNATEGHYTVGGTKAEDYDITVPATDSAKQWLGWGTALKPSHESIVVARKPLAGTVAQNVLRHGTGAINIDATRTAGSRWPPNVLFDESQADGTPRFFPTFRYTAKAPSTERPTADGVSHPTVKPVELIRWLIRLVTPPGGVVLDPFAGSGTTGEAAIHEHKRAIMVEREPTYLPLIKARLGKPMEIGFNFEETA